MKDKLRILHLVEFYFPSVGGSQIAVQEISERIAARGHSVTVATSNDDLRSFSNLNGVAVKQFDVSGNSVRGIEGKDIEKFKQFLISGKFDIIMTYNTQVWPTDLLLEVLDETHGKKVLVPVGFSEIENPAYRDYYESLIINLEKFSAIIFLSKRFRDVKYVNDHNVNTAQFTVYNGARTDEFQNLSTAESDAFKKQFNIPSSHQVILCVANFSGEKGHRELIKSFMIMPKTGVSLVLVGGGTPGWGDMNFVVKASKVLGKISRFIGKRIILLKYGTDINRPGLVEAYNAADIFVLPSHVECSPITLIETMASGTPFIATDTGNAAELVDDLKAGIITRTKNSGNGRVRASILGLAISMSRLLHKNNMRARLGANGRQAWLDGLTWDKIALRYEEIYKKL